MFRFLAVFISFVMMFYDVVQLWLEPDIILDDPEYYIGIDEDYEQPAPYIIDTIHK